MKKILLLAMLFICGGAVVNAQTQAETNAQTIQKLQDAKAVYGANADVAANIDAAIASVNNQQSKEVPAYVASFDADATAAYENLVSLDLDAIKVLHNGELVELTAAEYILAGGHLTEKDANGAAVKETQLPTLDLVWESRK